MANLPVWFVTGPPPTLPKLAEYDLVLALNQKTINSQWQHLYKLVKGDLNAQPPQHYLPHELETRPIGGAGIKGTILCPTLEITGNNSVRLNVKFAANPKGSFFTDLIGNRVAINGCSMSCVGTVKTTQIYKIPDGFLPTQTETTLKRYLAEPQKYQVVAVSCELENVLANLELKDANGNSPAEIDRGTFNLCMSSYFEEMSSYLSGQLSGGWSPYVIEYAIDQPNDVAVDMVPRVLRVSNTPDQSNEPTVNLLMLINSHNSLGPKAGVFSQSFATSTRESGHNGVLAISSDSFMKAFIQPSVIPKFHGPPTSKPVMSQFVSPSVISPCTAEWASQWSASPEIIVDTLRKKYEYSGQAKNTIRYSSLSLENPTEASKPGSKHHLILRVTQEHQLHCLMQTAADLPFGMFSETWSYAFEAHITFTVETAFHITSGEDGKLIATYSKAESRFPPMAPNDELKTRLVVEGVDPSPGDTTSVPVNIKTYGVFSIASAILAVATFVVPYFSQLFSQALAKMFAIPKFEGLQSPLKSVQDKVIMPAGDFITFAGLDSDVEGNVYCAIDYQTPS